MKLFINQLNTVLPDIQNWEQLRSILKGKQTYKPSQTSIKHTCSLLPANERRRASETVKLVFSACEPLFDASQEDQHTFESVFASSGGDYTIFDKICRTLCTEERFVSPTLFHNSVFNAAAGYWSIATKNRASTRSIAAAEYSAGMGFTESVSLLHCGADSVLLCCYDICPPEPLSTVSKIDLPAAFAFVISKHPADQCHAVIDSAQLSKPDPTTKQLPERLKVLEKTNPMMTLLPLLSTIALGESNTVQIPCSPSQSLEIRIRANDR